jgi:predicted transcriptional regulator
LLARIKQHRAQGVHVDDLTSPIDSNYQAKRSKIRKSLESLTKKNLLVKRTYKVTGVDVTKYSLPSSD